jgi:predicted peptidase
MERLYALRKFALLLAAWLLGGLVLAGCNGSANTRVSADDAIVGIQAIGYMAADGARLSAIAVEYNVDMQGAAVKASDYKLDVWTSAWDSNSLNYGSGNIGDVTRIYVNDQPAVSATGGSGKGKYVIIEVYTDYQYSSEQNFLRSLSAGVTQTGQLYSGHYAISPNTRAVLNYTAGQTGNDRTAQAGKYTITGVEGFKYYTNTPGTYGAAGPSFTAENCFSEETGLYQTVDMDYALYVPADYDPAKKYALVTVDHPAFSAGTHPFQAVATSRGASVFASDWAQQIVKTKHGLAGLIVVVPVYTQRVGDNAGTTAHFSALVKLWDQLQKTYSISADHIYGAGQSVGGMMILETNVRRDNYFAGILMYDNQWGQNYYKDQVFARGMTDPTYVETSANTPRYYPATDDLIWTYHWDSTGAKVYDGHDSNNYYYLTSDDNILVMNSSENFLSNNLWTEQNYLYKDLVGFEIPRLSIPDWTAALADQEQAVQTYLAQPSYYNGQSMGIRWVTFTGGSSQTTPVWSRRLNAGYEWLLNQTRSAEMARTKLDLNKPFDLAAQQETRVMPNFIDPKTGGAISYLTGKAGAGTRFYNTSWLRIGTNVTADETPGWLPAGMSHPVTPASIISVTPIITGGKLSAVAIEYSVDMSNAVIFMKGDAVLDSKGNARSDTVVMDTYDFYDGSGTKISGTTTNTYINSSPAATAGATRGSGSGRYVIVEIDTTSTAASVSVIQRATVRTSSAIASASAIAH